MNSLEATSLGDTKLGLSRTVKLSERKFLLWLYKREVSVRSPSFTILISPIYKAILEAKQELWFLEKWVVSHWSQIWCELNLTFTCKAILCIFLTLHNRLISNYNLRARSRGIIVNVKKYEGKIGIRPMSRRWLDEESRLVTVFDRRWVFVAKKHVEN